MIYRVYKVTLLFLFFLRSYAIRKIFSLISIKVITKGTRYYRYVITLLVKTLAKIKISKLKISIVVIPSALTLILNAFIVIFLIVVINSISLILVARILIANLLFLIVVT